jgi:hypothetical protein
MINATSGVVNTIYSKAAVQGVVVSFYAAVCFVLRVFNVFNS